MAQPRPITFLSDYGYEDEFAGVCRAVIAQIAPGAPLIDLSHGVARQDIRQGAIVLANALPSCPPGVHLAVVDPGVGSSRRAVAVAAAEGRFLVGPDNGLLSRALGRLGGALDAVELSRSPFRLEPVSATFHGRDLFAPVAAQIARGELPSHMPRAAHIGRHVDWPDDLPEIVYIDHYGNAMTGLRAPLLPAGGRLAISGRVLRRAGTFAEVPTGEAFWYENANGLAEIAVNGGDAADALGLSIGSPVAIDV
jgi:S-adenosylmethionine hydrolase